MPKKLEPKNKFAWISSFPIHPFLISVNAVLSLWTANLGQTVFSSILRSLAFAIIVGSLVFLVFRLICRNVQKSALLASMILLAFFYFGHLSELVQGKSLFGLDIGRYRYLLGAIGLLLILGFFLVLKSKATTKITAFLNILGFFMLFIALFQIAGYSIQSYNPKENPAQSALNESINQGTNNGQFVDQADVYYILADSFGRQDELLKDYDIDVSSFIAQLEEMGFVIPQCTHSNYQRTETAMTSTLNMNYLDALNIPADKLLDDESNINFSNYIKNNLVKQVFSDFGYQYITFKTGYPFLDNPESDLYFDAEEAIPFYAKSGSVNFYYMFLRTTMMRVFIDAQESNPNRFSFLPTWALQILNPKASFLLSNVYQQYSQNMYSLEQLEAMPALPGRKFVYAHLFLTHPPFTVYADGSIRTEEVLTNEDDAAAYRDSVLFASTQLIDTITKIIEESPVPPIIILQADHSFPMNPDRTRILNAYYLPGGGNDLIYPSITPVNTFRTIFNFYFGANYELLPDVSYSADNILPLREAVRDLDCVP